MVFRADFLARWSILLLLLLSACTLFEPRAINLPKEIDAVATPFVRDLQRGNRVAAEKWVAPMARDELANGFAEQSRKLKASDPLTPRFITFKPQQLMAPDDREATVIYAAKKGGKWTTLEVRLFRVGKDRFDVDYWKITHKAPEAKNYFPDIAPVKNAMVAVFAAMGLMGAIGLALIVWLARRKPHIVSPEPDVERRSAAITRRDDLSDGES